MRAGIVAATQLDARRLTVEITASLEAGCSGFPASGCGVRRGGGIEAREKERDGSGKTTPSNTGKRISIYGAKETGRYLPSLRGLDGPAT